MNINEKVLVETTCGDRSKALVPAKIFWRNREYLVEKIGLHHTFWRGREKVHVFSVVVKDGSFFRVELGTVDLLWTLSSIEV